MKLKQGDFVFVEWLDAHSTDEWQKRSDVDTEPTVIHSVGIVVDWTPRISLTIAQNHNTANDDLACTFVVPSGMISRIKKLK